MFSLRLESEDLLLEAHEDGQGKMSVSLKDAHSGKQEVVTMTLQELGAVVCLNLSGESEVLKSQTSADLYDIANPVVETICRECRPIP